MNWLTGAILGGLVGLVPQVIAIAVSKRYANRIRRMLRLASVRWARTTPHAPKPRTSDVLPDYFRETGSLTLDLVVYELSLRPQIPIMDLLYFEYLKARLLRGTVKKVLIVPWSGMQQDASFLRREEELHKNLRRVFGAPTEGQVTIVKSADLQNLSPTLIQESFLSSLEKLGSSTFLAKSSRAMGYKFRSYHDINQGHPEDLRLRSLVEHCMRGWLIYQYLEQSGLAGNDDDQITVGTIIWERELSKLLLLQNLQLSHPNIRVGLILGKDITYRYRLRRRPLPTYDGTAVAVFAERADLVSRISKKNNSELTMTEDIAHRLLLLNNNSNFDLIMSELASGASASNGLGQHAERALGTIVALRRMYGIRD